MRTKIIADAYHVEGNQDKNRGYSRQVAGHIGIHKIPKLVVDNSNTGA